MSRIYLGKIERAGLPISATVVTETNPTPPNPSLRWRKIQPGSFVLEQWVECVRGAERHSLWVEVPFLQEP